jgi:hypothetical protein
MLEICQQLRWSGETICAFLFTPMPMIAFPFFVVIPENAYFINDVRQAELKRMSGSCQRLVKTPEHEFSELVISIHDTLTKQLRGFHVGDYTNAIYCCQLQQHIRLRGPNDTRELRNQRPRGTASGTFAAVSSTRGFAKVSCCLFSMPLLLFHEVQEHPARDPGR